MSDGGSDRSEAGVDAFFAQARTEVDATVAVLASIHGDRDGSGAVEVARYTCLDARDGLQALSAMLARPFEAHRSPGLRRMIEAGLTLSAEAAAACRSLGDRDQAIADVAESTEALAASLRMLLSRFVDDDVEERSGAT